jgi:hypothetical protein
MMMHEFEALIGKRVDIEVFEVFEAMYNAVDLDKREFVALLNIKAIPEAGESLKAKAEAEAIRGDIQRKIDKAESLLQVCIYEQLKGIFIDYNRREGERLKRQIAELKHTLKMFK